MSRCFPLSHKSILLNTDPVSVCVSNFVLEWGDAQGSVPAIDLPASQFVVRSTWLVHYQFPWRGRTWAAFHFIWMPLWSEREGGEEERVRQNEEERADCQWEPLSGWQHKLVWGKCNNRGQEAEAVSPQCFSDLPLTWVYLKPGRGNSTAVWCVLQHWPAKAACCASWHNLIEKSEI